MPRTIDPAELTLLQSGFSSPHVRAFVADADGDWIDLSTLEGFSWIDGVELREGVDEKIAGCTIRLLRDASSTLSLSPLRTDSTLNVDDAMAYAPLLDAGREVYVEVATTALAGAPVSWHQVFVGAIDTVECSGPIVVLSCRDQGWLLADRWSIKEVPYDLTETPTDVEDVIQAVLNEVITEQSAYAGNPNGDPAPTLYTPVSPSYLVKTFKVEREPVLDAVLRLAQVIGWDLRYKWDEVEGEFRLTFFDVVRGKTTPDWTLQPSQYLDVTQCAIDRANVRNDIMIQWGPANHPSRQHFFDRRRDEVSIARYGRRSLIFTESTESAIDTSEEANDLIDYALADLAYPDAEVELTMPVFWPVELHDLVRLTANGVHVDTDTDLAVVGIVHRFGGENPTTTLMLRGRPAAHYYGWIKRAGRPGDVRPTPLALRQFHVKARTTTTVTHGWIADERTHQVWVYEADRELGSVADPAPNESLPPTRRLTGATTEDTVTIPPYGTVRIVWYVPRDQAGQAGRVQIAYVEPPALKADIFGLSQATGASGLFTDVTVKVTDPQALGGTLEVWCNKADADDADPTGSPDGSIVLGSTPATVGPGDSWDLTGGGTGFLLDNVAVHPGRGKRIWFRFTNSVGIATEQIVFTLLSRGGIIDANGDLLDGTITRSLAFAAGLRLPNAVDVLPADNADGDLVFLRTDRKLYLWNGSAFVADPTAAQAISAGYATIGALAVNSVRAEAIVADAVQAQHIAVAVLDEISTDLGIMVAGALVSVSGQTTIDLNATGTDPVISHPAFSLNADGSADFSGTVSALRFLGQIHAESGITFGQPLVGGSGSIIWTDALNHPGDQSAITGDWDNISITTHSGASVFLTGDDVQIAGDTISFNITSPPSVTGAKGGNAALASLLAELAGLGLIDDNTT